MIVAEGGPSAFVRAVRISVPRCTGIADARHIAENTIAHALWDFAINDTQTERSFIMFLGNRWAPVGAKNDPGDLNRNWTSNVIASLREHGGLT